MEFGFVAPGKQKRECDFELFKILYQELRWTEDETKKGIDEKDPFAVFYNPLSPPPSDFPSYCLNVGVFSEWGGKVSVLFGFVVHFFLFVVLMFFTWEVLLGGSH